MSNASIAVDPTLTTLGALVASTQPSTAWLLFALGLAFTFCCAAAWQVFSHLLSQYLSLRAAWILLALFALCALISGCAIIISKSGQAGKLVLPTSPNPAAKGDPPGPAPSPPVSPSPFPADKAGAAGHKGVGGSAPTPVPVGAVPAPATPTPTGLDLVSYRYIIRDDRARYSGDVRGPGDLSAGLTRGMQITITGARVVTADGNGTTASGSYIVERVESDRGELGTYETAQLRKVNP